MTLRCPEVKLLWDKIDQLEQERRFEGRPYPKGMAKFSGRLTGQGFFPGGDGLWRDDVKAPSTSPFPVGGIMFLGNDFGTLESFKKTLQRGYENVPTWQRLKERLEKAAIPGEVGFYTNAVLGLRTEQKAVERINRSPDFCKFCDEFLRFQLETMNPRMIVALGRAVKSRVCSTLNLSSMAETTRVVAWQGTKLVLHFTSHPYSDFKQDDRWAERVELLKNAWEEARS
jgi:uracil DNA glycosylase superfamily protein